MPTPPLLPSQAPPKDLVLSIGRLAAVFLANYRRGGSIYGIRLGNGDPAVVMSGPDALTFLAHEGQDVWRADQFRQAQNKEYGATRTLVSADGDDHQRLRQVQRRGYSRTALDGQLDTMVDIVDRCLEQHRDGDIVEARDLFLAIAVRQLSRAVLGIEISDEEADALPRFLETVVRVTLSKHWPETFLATTSYRQARQSSMDLADRIVAAHADSEGTGGSSLVLDLLAAGRDDAAFLPPNDLRAAVLGPFIAGLDQVVNSCCFMLCALLQHPRWLAVAQAEARQALAGRPLSTRTLRDAKTLYGAMLETLRLYPVAPAVQGTVSRPFAFGGFDVEAEQTLIVGTSVSHFLPEFYQDPFTFDPRRMVEPRHEHRRRGAFAAFGVGRHRCLGAGLAEDMMLLIMATFLKRTECTLEPTDYRLVIGGSPAPIPQDLKLKLTITDDR